MVTLGSELLIGQVGAAKSLMVDALRSWGGTGALAVDCAALDDIDAAGLQLITTLAIAVHERGGRLWLCGCKPKIRHRIEATALADWFDFDTAEVT